MGQLDGLSVLFEGFFEVGVLGEEGKEVGEGSVVGSAEGNLHLGLQHFKPAFIGIYLVSFK